MEDKLKNEQDEIIAKNKQNLKQWAGGVVQKQIQENERKMAGGDQTGMVDFDTTQDQKDEIRFGDPLKLIKSVNIKSKINQQDYRLITTQSGYKYFIPKCKFL